MSTSIKPFPFDIENGQLDFYELYTKFVQPSENSGELTHEETVNLITKKCNVSEFHFQDHQKLVSDFLNPSSGYRGLLLCHEPGTGKTLAAINIAEQFIPQVKKYNTKIYVLVPGPSTKQNFINEILFYRTQSVGSFMKKKEYDPTAKRKIIREIKENYTFVTQNGFTSMVIGKNQYTVSATGKNEVYRNARGVVERKRSTQKLDYLRNTILIIDEAHNMTNKNAIREAVNQLINHPNTSNLKILLLTATPMKNTVLDIVPLMNFILPENRRMTVNDLVKNINTPPDMLEFKDNWYGYLKNHVGNHISYVKTSTLTFPDVRYMGTQLEKIETFRITNCNMSMFQSQSYQSIERTNDGYGSEKDIKARAFKKNLQAIQLFCFPILGKQNTLTYTFRLKDIRNQISSMSMKDHKRYRKLLLELLISHDIKIETLPDNFIEFKNGIIDGEILNQKYLKVFSSKYYKCLHNVLSPENIKYKAFIYSDRVDVGVFLFENILKQNGFLQYSPNIHQSNGIYNRTIYSNVRCFECGVLLKNHNKNHTKSNTKSNHDYHPATYITYTGGKDDDDNQKELNFEKFNHKNNVYGEHIKIILASRVMREGRSLKNCCSVHILVPPFTITTIQQVVGRARRHCSHIDMISEHNPIPEVKVWLYCCSFDRKILSKSTTEYTNDQELYIKAYRKYRLIKKAMGCIRDISFDCAIQYGRNSINRPCASELLNDKYWDKTKKAYKYPKLERDERIENDKEDLLTTQDKYEIEFYAQKIQEFIFENSILGNVYFTARQIIDHVAQQFKNRKSRSFNQKILLSVINRYLISDTSELQANPFWLYDKELNEGYLIQREIPNLSSELMILYIYQPVHHGVYVPLYTRLNTLGMSYVPTLSLDQFIKKRYPDEHLKVTYTNTRFKFDEKYYSKRTEHLVIGIIVKDTKNINNMDGIFNIRDKIIRNNNYMNNRIKGVPKKDGGNYIYKSHEDLKSYCDLLKLEVSELFIKNEKSKKQYIGKLLLQHLMYKEQVESGENKRTYMIIPLNHPTIPFPLNLDDRKDVLSNLKVEFPKIISIKKLTKKIVISLSSSNAYIETKLLQIKAYSIEQRVFELQLNVVDYDLDI